MAAGGDVLLGGDDLLERSADVDRGGPGAAGGGPGAARVGPGDGAVQGPVQLEDPWPVPVAQQAAPVARRQGVRAHALDVARDEVEEADAGRRPGVQCPDAAAGLEGGAPRVPGSRPW